MPEEVLFETESMRSRSEVADLMRSVADKLDAGDPVTVSAGGDSITLDPPERVTFEVKAERETSTGATEGELSIEFELEWDEGDASSDGGDGDLSVE